VSARLLGRVALLALLAANTWAAAGRIVAFLHRYRGEKALAAAELSVAYERLELATAWQPGDAPGYILIARTIVSSQANGVPIRALDGKEATERLAIGVGALARAISLNPSDAWAWFNLGELYRGYQSGRGRLERLKAVVKANTPGAGPTAPAAKAPARGSQPEDRVMAAAALMAESLEPNFYFYHDFLALLYHERGLLTEAAREIEWSFVITPSPDAHSVLGRPGLAEDLSEAILRGIERAGTGPLADPLTAARGRAEILELIGRNDEAIQAFRLLGAMDGKEQAISSDLAVARILQSEGKYEESLAWLGRVRQADPNGDVAGAAFYSLGIAHSRLGDHKKAVDELRRFLTKSPASLNVLMELANELLEVGQRAEAEKIYLAAVRNFPDDPEAYVALIQHLLRERRTQEAFGYVERLKSIAPEDDRAGGFLRQIEDERAESIR